jgi:mono/diheme cytochrome c family protein
MLNNRSGIITVCILGALALLQCNYAGNQSGLHFFLDMHDSPAVEPQEEDPSTLDERYEGSYEVTMGPVESWGGPGSATRTAPEGTVPRNKTPYLYAAADFETPAQELQNPLPLTKKVLERGQKQYNTYCAVCHGYLGMGDGPVTPRFSEIPALAGPDSLVNNWEPGRIYHIITVGRARMRPYAAQIDEKDRWAIIHYVQLLQRQEQ